MGYNDSVHLLNTRIFASTLQWSSFDFFFILQLQLYVSSLPLPSTRATDLPSPSIAISLTDTSSTAHSTTSTTLRAIGHATDELRRNGEDGEDNGERYGFL